MHTLITYLAVALISLLALVGCATTINESHGQSGNVPSRFIRHDPEKTTVIIFVHGVLGDSVSTWTNPISKAYWPELMAKDPDFNDANIYVFNYPSSAFGKSLSVNELAEAMRMRLTADHVIDHPRLVFISHSMGGLVTRAYLVKYREQASKTPIAYFYATPTEGSPAATLASIVSNNSQFKVMYPMKSDEYLADLQRDWLAARLGIRSFCAYETKKTYGILIVDQRSASNLCTEPIDPISENHIDIVKPADLKSDTYAAFKNAYATTTKEGVNAFASQRKNIKILIESDDPITKIKGINLIQEAMKTYPPEKQDLINLLQEHLIKFFPQDKQIEPKYLPVLKHAIQILTRLPRYDENGFPYKIDLHQIRVENLDLSSTNFKDISLWGCQFYNVNFSKSSFINTDLGGVQFNECSLEYCKFEGAKITGSFMDKENGIDRPTRFIKTRLYGSDIEKAQIEFCELFNIPDYPVDKLIRCSVKQR